VGRAGASAGTDGMSVREGDFLLQLRRINPIFSELSSNDKTPGGPWYLSGGDEDCNLGVSVFDGAEPRRTAIEELIRRSQHESGQPKSIDIWNGIIGRGNTSSINVIIGPGVSWMLCLPHALTPSQVPEARDLLPVMHDGQQQGTIVVSVTDGVFDVSNRDHVKAANHIEIRLADQDLLPRYVHP
jgi:hypothetical protein